MLKFGFDLFFRAPWVKGFLSRLVVLGGAGAIM
jgi:hypothetical protein